MAITPKDEKIRMEFNIAKASLYLNHVRETKIARKGHVDYQYETIRNIWNVYSGDTVCAGITYFFENNGPLNTLCTLFRTNYDVCRELIEGFATMVPYP